MTNFSSFWAARRLALLALPLAGLLARPAQAQVALSFAAPVTYNAGNPSFAQDVVVADVNTDGLPDLVSLNFNTSNTVGVLLGTGAGTFGAATFYSPGANSSPRGVTVADVNNDGLPDLVTANNSSNTLGVLLGKSAASGGGFQPAQQYATEPQTQYPSRPYSVAVADLNGDGLPDLVAANFGTNTLGVLLGKSAASGGGFEPVQIYPTSTGGSLPRDVKVADVNGDGVPDLITALSNTGDIGVLLGKSAASGGGFQPVQTYSLGRGDAYPYSVVVADINADGLPDLVAPLTNYNAVGVLLGKSAANGGGFQPVQTYSTINQQLVDVAVGDLNSDGVLDIVTGSRTNSSVGMGVLLGKSAASGGGFQTINFIAPGGGRVQVADVSGDGRPDLVTGSVAVQLNTTGAPVLDFRARTEGPIGATLTLTGRNLDRVTSVSFNGTAATFTIVNASTITTTVPVGATTGPLTVTSPAPYGTSNAIAFSIVVPPTALTGTVLNLTTTSAFLRGSVSDNGGAATLVESGLVYVRGTGLPTLADIVATRITAGSNAFSTTATGLLPGTTYTVRSYGINSAGLSYGNPVSFTTLTPTSVVSITRADPNPSKVNYGLLRFTVTFAAPVTGVNKDNFGVTTSSNVSYAEVSSVSGAGTTYTVTVAVSYNIGTGTLGLNLKSTTAIVPSVTNPLPFVGEAYTLDSAPPTATLSSAAGSATSTAPIPFTVTFSEPVSGLTASSLSVSNGTVTTALTSVGNAYSFGVTPTASGPVTVSVPANAAQDAAGNGSAAAAPLSVAYTPLTTAPSVTLLSPAAGPVGTSVTISGTNLSGATAVSFNGTAASSFVVNSPTSLTAVVAAGTTTGPVRVTTPGGSASSAIPFVVRAAPITVADAYTTPAGVALTGNVLTNDLGSDLRAILITRPAHGTLALNPDGSFSYQPTTGYVGPDSFLYYACNVGTALVCGDPATVSLSVVGSTAPITVADAYTTPAGVALTGNVLTNDLGSDLRAILITRPAHGTLALNPDGSFNYQPAAGYVGSDSFLYYACNVGAALICGDPATVSITVAPAPNTRVAATPSGAAPAPAAFATPATAKPVATATRGAAAAAEATPALALTGYPNPFGDELQLSFSLPTAQAYTLALYDAQGRLVQQLARGQAAVGQAQQLTVPTRSYAAGLYLLRLSTATGTQLLKLIKQ